MTTWINYFGQKPTKEGLYNFRLKSKVYKDLIVQFVAEMRMRGAGFERVLSPEFDHWDGWNVILPKFIEWSPRENQEKIGYGEQLICLEGAPEILPCPFCKKIPKLHGTNQFVLNNPHEWNIWWFICCEWVNQHKRFDRPFQAIEARNELLKR